VSLTRILTNASEHGKSELNRIDYLDGWRGMAIALVLISHFLRVEGADLGRMGVDIFFVLSGVLMAKLLFVKRVPLSVFYKRRISRILPVFFIFLTTISLLSFLLELSNEHNNFIYNLLFIRSYYPISPSIWNTGLPIGHLWSLNVEEHCYILLSMITLISLFYKREYLPILLLGCCSVLLQYLYIKFPSIASENYSLKTEIVASFLLISAGYSLIKHTFEKHVPSWAPIIALLLAFLCYTDYSPHWTAKWALSPFLLAFSVNHLNLIPVFFKSLLNFRPLRLLGIWSFSIYLWQQPLYFYGTKSSDAFLFAGPLLLAVSILIGAASFYFIENPIRKYLNDKW
jgi:peptidoglycan/LPS O-acetylase OafA/YrhL